MTQEHKKIYKTKLWQDTRKAVIYRDKGICYFCGKLVKRKANVHHLQELNEENFTDFDVAFNLDNLVCCHHECHNEHHHRFGYKDTIVNDDLSIDYSKRNI